MPDDSISQPNKEKTNVCPFSEGHTDRLARIETKLDNALGWLSKRDKECKDMEEKMNTIRIEQGKQGIVIWLFSGMISAVIAGIISYFSKK